MKKHNYKLRQFKDSASKRYPYRGLLEPGFLVCEMPDGYVVHMTEDWMKYYFFFTGIVQSVSDRSADVKLYGTTVTLIRKKK